MDQNDATFGGRKPQNPAQTARQKRLAAALRENLKRRKAQGKARISAPDSEPGPQPAGQKPLAQTE